MLVRGVLAFVLALALNGTADAVVLTLPGVSEGAMLPSTAAAPNCGGQGISPPLSWSNVPAGVTSFALMLFDLDAPGGPGRSHWVLYGIPATVTSIPAGYADGVRGVNASDERAFGGYCPGVGDTPHHYAFSLYATDLAPTALEPGKTRDALLAALHGHVKAVGSFVGRYGR